MEFYQFVFSFFLLSEALSIVDKRIINEKVKSDNHEAPSRRVEVVEGSKAELPCRIISDLREEESPKLVLWFYNQSFTPFYTFNNMDDEKPPSHWRDPQSSLASRSQYSTNPPRSLLSIANIGPQDAGQYKCRVDYHLQQTSFQLLDLSVIVLPKAPVIYYNNQLVKSNKIHVKENQSLTLTCESEGGTPPPILTWWQHSKLKDASYERIAGKVLNTLRIQRVTRADLDTIFSCEASNNNLSIPLSTSVKIDILVPPVSVKILRTGSGLVVGQPRTVECEVRGARPNHRVSWWKNGARLSFSQTESSPDGGTLVSSIVIVPEMTDSEATLQCRAETPGLAEVREHKWQLPVQYLPQIEIVLGGSLNRSNIREFDDVYFECRVKANPPSRNIQWRHDGRTLLQDKTAGIIISGNSLAIQRIRRKFIGNYSCSAVNDIGVGRSNRLPLDIKYSPACSPNQQFVYSVAKMSSVEVSCEMIANPEWDLSFKWTFNTTANTLNIPESDVAVMSSKSVVRYTPKTEMDFGSLVCWASNQVGLGVPCVYHLLPIGPPEPPADCLTYNITYSSLQVSCEVKHDNSLPEVVAELTLAETGERLGRDLVEVISRPLTNKTELVITGLLPGTTYTVKVQVRNKFGTSDAVYIPLLTKLEPIKQLAETKVKNEEGRTEVLAMILGGLVTSVLLLTVLLLVSFNYRRRLLEENTAATISSTAAPLLENSGRPREVAADFSSFTTSGSKQSTTTTFNSSVFVPSISSELYGQIIDISTEGGFSTALHHRLHSNNLQSVQCEEVCGRPGEPQASDHLQSPYLGYETPQDGQTARSGLDFREPGNGFSSQSTEGDLIQCPNHVMSSKESRI